MERVKETQYLKSLKSFIVSVLLLVLLTSITACKKEEPLIPIWETLGVEKEEYIINRMKERYGHEFIFLEDEPLTSASGEDVFIVGSKEFPERRITVYLNHKTGDIHDSYLKYYLRDEVEEELSKVVGEVYEDYKVFFNTGGYSKLGERPDMTVREFMEHQSENGDVHFTIIAEDPDYKENRDFHIDKVRQLFKEEEILPHIVILYVHPKELEQINHENIYKRLNDIKKEKWAYTRGSFTIGEDYEFVYTEWRDYE